METKEAHREEKKQKTISRRTCYIWAGIAPLPPLLPTLTTTALILGGLPRILRMGIQNLNANLV
jgi:hypothetical protein